LPDDADRRGGGARGDPGPVGRADRRLAAPGEPRLSRRAAAPLVVGAVLAALLVLVFPATHRATLPAALVLAGLGLLAGSLRPAGATLALVSLAPLLAGLPRAWGETAPAPLLPLVSVSLLAGALARRRRDGEPSALPRSVVRWGGAFLLVAAASALASALRGETLYLLLRGGASPVFLNGLGMTATERTREAIVLLSVLAALWAGLDACLAVAREARGRGRLATALAAGLAAASAPVPAERLLDLPLTVRRWHGIGRLSGLSSDPNALGIALAAAAPAVLGLLFLRPGRARAGLAAVAILLALPVLELSGSRTGLLLLGAAALAGGAGLARSGGRARRAVLLAGGAAAAALALVATLAPRGGSAAAGGLFQRLGASLSAPSATLLASHRPMFWGAAFDMIAAEPVSGVGLAGFPFEFPAVFERRRGAPAVATDNATNLLLDVAAECGVPALLLALAAAGPLLVRAGEAALARAGVDPLARAAGASLCGFALASLTGSHLRFPEVALWVAAVASLLPEAPEREALWEGGPRRVLPLLAASGVLGALLSTLATASPAAPFRAESWAGLHDRGRPHRWTSANAYRLVAPGERDVRLTLANERPDGRPVVLRVAVDDVPAGALTLPAGGARRYRVTFPRGARVVRLTVDPTFVPLRLTGAPDSRTLGVRLHADGGETP